MQESLFLFYSGDNDKLLNNIDASSVKSNFVAIISLGSISKQYSYEETASMEVNVVGLPIMRLQIASSKLGGVSMMNTGRPLTQLICCLPMSMTNTAISIKTS